MSFHSGIFFLLRQNLAQMRHIFAAVKNQRYEEFIRKSPANGSNQKIK